MNRSRSLLFAIPLLAAACTAPAELTQEMSEMRTMPAQSLAETDHLILTISQDQRPALMAASRDIEARYGVNLVAEWPLKSIDVHCLVLRPSDSVSVADVLERMGRDPAIRTAQRIQGFGTLGGMAYADNLYPLQIGLHQIKAPQVHSIATGKDIRVAVIDTGIDFLHPDLAGRDLSNKDFAGADPMVTPPPEEHGTVVAGIIAANGQNSEGMVGVAPEAAIVGLRACWQDSGDKAGRCNTFSLAKALNSAMLQKARVINLSLTGPRDALVEELIVKAQGQGTTVVAARGEAGDADFPASVPGVVAVRASPAAADGSVVAPGVDIISTVPKGGYDYFSGASVSAAHVSGVAALLLQSSPGIDQAKLNGVLTGQAWHDPAAPRMWSVDACQAMLAISNSKNFVCE